MFSASSTTGCNVKRLQAFGGGPLSLKVGNALSAAGVPVVTGFGATECGIVTSIPSREDIADGDWLWVRIADGIDVRWIPQGDGMYECHVLVRASFDCSIFVTHVKTGYGGVSSRRRESGRYQRLCDRRLVCKAPNKGYVEDVRLFLWNPRFILLIFYFGDSMGRRDDVIVLASGEKTVPGPMESIINSSPMVEGVVMFGRQRNQVGILIEPRPEYRVDTRNDQAVQAFRDKVW